MKDIKKKDLICLVISILMITFVSCFGFFGIKDAAKDKGIMDKGYRNLSEVNVYAGIKNGRGFIITSKHLVSENNKVTVEFGNRGRADGEAVYYYTELDAAVVRVKKEDFEHDLKEAKGVEPLSKGEYDSISLNKKVFFT